LQHTYTLINNRDYQAAVDHIIAVAEFTTNQAWIFLANALNSGTDVEARPEEALRILSELANTGDSEGQMSLGGLLVQRGTLGETQEGLTWLELAADQGEKQALINLCHIYQRGKPFVEADASAAVKYLPRLAELGDTEAMLTMASAAKNGYGCEPSEELELAWNLRAAAGGNAKGNYNAGVAIEFGRGTTKNDVEAFRHYQVAAVAGVPEAQHNLGARYFNGLGVERDLESAHEWYLHAAQRGSPMSQHCLGLIYLKGDGRPANLAEALGWFLVALECGSEQSRPYIEALAAAIPPEQVQLAQEYLVRFRPESLGMTAPISTEGH